MRLGLAGDGSRPRGSSVWRRTPWSYRRCQPLLRGRFCMPRRHTCRAGHRRGRRSCRGRGRWCKDCCLALPRGPQAPKPRRDKRQRGRRCRAQETRSARPMRGRCVTPKCKTVGMAVRRRGSRPCRPPLQRSRRSRGATSDPSGPVGHRDIREIWKRAPRKRVRRGRAEPECRRHGPSHRSAGQSNGPWTSGPHLRGPLRSIARFADQRACAVVCEQL